MISELMVMHSNAGYYIGRELTTLDDGFVVPYSRDSIEYYPSRSKAQIALDEGSYTLRPNP